MKSDDLTKLLQWSDEFAVVARKADQIMTLSYLTEDRMTKLVCDTADHLLDQSFDLDEEEVVELADTLIASKWATKH